MANLAARNIDVEVEKEDVCFLATLVMGVGESLAAIDEKTEESSLADMGGITEHVNKKLRKG